MDIKNKRILAIDVGDVRTGVAVSDPLGIIASPLENIINASEDELIEKLGPYISKNGVGTVVIGFPKNMNGTVGERGEKAKRLSEEIEKTYKVETVLWDERLTTVSALRALSEGKVRGKKRRGKVDGLSAVLILQGYLDKRRS